LRAIEACRLPLAADGSVTDQPVTILGPDLRKTGDGRTLGLAKIAAGLTGLATDDLHQRLKRQQRRQAWINGVVAACLMVLVGTGGVLYWQKQQLAEVSVKLEKNEQEATGSLILAELRQDWHPPLDSLRCIQRKRSRSMNKRTWNFDENEIIAAAKEIEDANAYAV